MNPTQRAGLRTLVHSLLPTLGREALLDLLARCLEAGPDALPPELADPMLEALWAQPETLGWAHQYAQEAVKEQAYDRLLKVGQKVQAHEIPAVTQLFTPAWIVQFLVQNSLGRLWLEMHPDSALRAEWTWLLPEASDVAGQRSWTLERGPVLAREIRVLDPACGAMHFGLGAYDLLARCYEEELDRAGEPGWPAQPSVTEAVEIPAAILTENLYGLEIDPKVLRVASWALRLKARVQAEPNLFCLPAPLGALDRSAGPTGHFHVVLTNPPYLARKNADPTLADHLEAHYPEGKGDLYTAFLLRCLEWLAPGGRLGMIAQSSFMFIGSYEGLRSRVLAQVAIEGVAHLGPGAFAELGGEKVNTAAFVLRREDQPERRDRAVGTYIRLLDGGEEEKRVALHAALQPGAMDRLFTTPQAAYGALTGAPWLYWVPADLRKRYQQGDRLGNHARFCRGITTADNARFVRYWWEVGLEAIDFTRRSIDEAAVSEKRWFPYMKGGGPVRWYGNILHVVDWANGGRALRESGKAAVRNLPYQFREGVTYSSVTGGSLTARFMDPGFLFDQASNALFVHDPADQPLLLALLNHPVAGFTVGFNPTVNIVEADLNRIPWPRVDRRLVARQVARCVDLARQIDRQNPLSPYFQQPSGDDGLHGRLRRAEATLNHLIDEALGLSPGALRLMQPRPAKTEAPPDPREIWVSYALGVLLGRCRPGSYGGGPLLTNCWTRLAPLVRPDRRIAAGEAPQAVAEVLTILQQEPPDWDLTAYLARTYAKAHARSHKQRPVFRLDDQHWTCRMA